ncbi:hypothetical protein GCM10009676_17880 [Prauserella halophila]|uniref:Helix-hairpin-helix protein n=1 Tax=Prauserella halophila TaxID=185641 RepID=A0ABN1W6D8_9PSEU|nr:hypothetical protein [Prauserella halophila]MCP2236010.1 Helix-hairpin-helix domain [Prauserella halophila]
MTTVSQLRKAALALPGTEEGTHLGMAAFSVRGKGFASVAKGGWVQLRLPADEADAALAVHPSGERLARAGTPIGFRVPLTDVNGKDLNALVRAAWTHRAPKRLVTATSQDGNDGDLPASIGKPATGALLGAGITTLAQVATRTEQELLALHGVGPKAVRILREVLAEQGRSLRE